MRVEIISYSVWYTFLAKGGDSMKTMTCRQMGGPCDTKIHGETAEELLKNAQEHVHTMEDEGHKKVVTMIQDMQKNPTASKEWNDKFKKDFDALPEG